MMAHNTGRECRRAHLAIREQAEAPSYVVEGYATTFDDPYLLYEESDGPVHEMVSRHALDDADLSDVIYLYDHEGEVYARTRNSLLALSIDDKGLFCRVDLSATANSRAHFDNIACGNVCEMSWCFVIEEEHWDEATRTMIIDRVGKVYDVSGVSIPADPYTCIAPARKRSLDGVIQQTRAERLEKERRDKLKMLRLKIKIAATKED